MTTWNEHVANFRGKHPDLSFKEVLIGASKTYQKKGTKKTKKKTLKASKITMKSQKSEKLIY